MLGFGALSFTLLQLVDAGWSGVTEFGGVALLFAWPTALALTLMVAGPLAARRLGRTLGAGTAALAGWTLSIALYVGVGLRPLRFLVSLAIWSGTPVIVVYLIQQAIERAPFERRTKLTLTAVVALVMVWCTAPTALVIDCAMGVGCP